jgi:L-amino acid N-acyltransferase YncA
MITSPFPASSAGELSRWLNSPRDPNFDDFADSDPAGVETALAVKSGCGQTFALTPDGTPIGFLAFAPASPVMGFFAGMVIAPEQRGRGLGSDFLANVVFELRSQGFRKLSALFFADNVAIANTFRSVGAVEEGYLRRAAVRGGELIDMRLWSFTETRVD